MKPLASSEAEMRTMGVGQVFAGAGFVIVGIAAGAPDADLIGVPLPAALFGGLMYLLLYRPAIRSALAHARPAPTGDRERPARTRLRVGATIGGLAAFFAFFAVATEDPYLLGGMLAGNGAAALVVARRVRRWESARNLQLLREPRWRWRGRGARGSFTSEDFYTEPAT